MRTRCPPGHRVESPGRAARWDAPRPFAPPRAVQRVVKIEKGVATETGLPPTGNIPLGDDWVKFDWHRWANEPEYKNAIRQLYRPYQAPAYLYGKTRVDVDLEELTGPLITESIKETVETSKDSSNWYEPLGGDPVESLARKLQAAYEDKGDELYGGSSIGGVIRVVEQGSLDQYKDLGEFLVAVEKNTEWEADGGGLEDYFGRREKFSGLTPVTEVSYSQLREYAQEGTEITSDMYDSPYMMIDQAIWTDGMGPCITVAMTATHGGKRYNTLLHSMNLEAEGEHVVGEIERLFDGKQLPAFKTLEDKQFFIVGGDYKTLGKAKSILAELLGRKYDVTQATVTAEPAKRKLTKALLVTAAGQVAYAAYDPKTENF